MAGFKFVEPKREEDFEKFAMTPVFRVSFPNVFRPNKEGKKGIVMIFDKEDDFSNFDKMLKETMNAEWGSKTPKNLMLPLHDGDDSSRPEYEGSMYVNGKIGKFFRGVVGPQREEILEEDLYPGCYARAIINLYSWRHQETKRAGVSVNVCSIQKVKEGDPFTAGLASPEDDFTDFENDTSVGDL